MKTQVMVCMVVCGLVIGAAGCSKKTETLEEMQQPMSPEDLNRIKNQTVGSPEGAAPAAVAPMPGTGIVPESLPAAVEPLPPEGPYKPSPKDIQAALKNAGYYMGEVDGKVGPKTKKAIESFQTANGLAADGKVGPKTWSLLSTHLSNPEPSASAPITGVAE